MLSTIFANDDFTKVVEQLPLGPKTLADLSGKLATVDFDLDELARCVGRDAKLASGIVAVTNTDAYVAAEPARTVEEAIARLGLDETFRVAGAVAIAQLTELDLPVYGVSSGQLRSNALFTALLMESLATEIGLDARVAFTAAVARTVGKLVLNQAVYQTARFTGDLSEVSALADWEAEMLGYANHEIGCAVLTAWEFAADIPEAVNQHYTPALGASKLALLLNVAAAAAHHAGHGFPGESAYWECAEACRSGLKVSDAQLQRALDKAHRRFDRLNGALG